MSHRNQVKELGVNGMEVGLEIKGTRAKKSIIVKRSLV